MLVIIEGLDRTGKSSVAEHYEKNGYELVHMSAPDKSLSPDLFLEQMVQLVGSAATKDIVLDRSYYGELVWPTIYKRESLLNDESLETLRELESSVGTTRILMWDHDVAGHWKRCVDNKEPLTKGQFVDARKLFFAVGEKYGFELKTLRDLPAVWNPPTTTTPVSPVEQPQQSAAPKLTKEQLKLETANAINDVLSKRIIKGKGDIYDTLEQKVRSYLNDELAQIFGGGSKQEVPFSSEEVKLLKFFCNKLKAGK